jgi:hypothetical protein
MATTTFIDNQTTIYAAWLNDVNNAVYNGIFVSPSITATSMICTGTASGTGFTALINNTFTSPGPFGSVTPNTGRFTTLTAASASFTSALPAGSGGTGLTSVGTIGNVLTSNGSAWVSSAPATVRGLGFNGETWRNVSGSRSSGTTYTNTNGYPIMICVSTSNGTNQGVTIVVNGVTVSIQNGGGSGYTQGVMGTAIVPTGATYSATYYGGFPLWTELY